MSVWTYELEPFLEERIPEFLFLALRFGPDERELLKIGEKHFRKRPDAEYAHVKALTVERLIDHTRYHWKEKIEAEERRLRTQSTLPKAVDTSITPFALKGRKPTDPRKIEIAAIKAYKVGISCLDICRKMDRQQERKTGLSPLDTWVKKSGQRTWEGNYRHKLTSSAVQKYVSEIRAAGR